MAVAPLMIGATVAGSALSAASTIAGGNAAAAIGGMQQQAANYQAQQLQENASTEIGTAQRQMLDTQLKTQSLQSTARARAAAGGLATDVGSPATTQAGIAQRGSYQAMLDLWNGQNRASGLENQATATRYSGDIAALGGKMQQSASYLSAAGTLASGMGAGARQYGMLTYPSIYGRMGYG